MTNITPIISPRHNLPTFQLSQMGSFLKQGWIFTHWYEKIIILFSLFFTVGTIIKNLINLS